MLSKQRKALESVTERLDTSTASGRMFFNTIASFAEFESAQTSERTFNAMSSKVGTKHLGGVAPIGYKLEKGAYKIVPTEVDVVRKIFELYTNRRSLNATANAMNDSGLLTRKGKKWTHVRIKEVLTNPVYVGQVAWRKTSRGKGRLPQSCWLINSSKTHQEIISKPSFQAIQQMIKSNNNAD